MPPWPENTGAMIVGPGAVGTMLQSMGLELARLPEGWNLERPETVRALHAAYAAAGARWALANTFGGNRFRLQVDRLVERLAEVNRAAVLAAREGAPGLPVLGSLGPTGIQTPGDWAAAYAEQVEILSAAGADGFLVETIIGLEEGRTAVRAATAACRTVWATITPGADGNLLDGTLLEEAAAHLFGAGATVIGVNCGAGPESMLAPVRRLVHAGIAPVLAAPNAGLPHLEGGRAGYALGPDGFAQAAIQLQEAGVRYFAGCCGTTPDHIRAAAQALTTLGDSQVDT